MSKYWFRKIDRDYVENTSVRVPVPAELRPGPLCRSLTVTDIDKELWNTMSKGVLKYRGRNLDSLLALPDWRRQFSVAFLGTRNPMRVRVSENPELYAGSEFLRIWNPMRVPSSLESGTLCEFEIPRVWSPMRVPSSWESGTLCGFRVPGC
jgi:hypothetical protein